MHPVRTDIGQSFAKICKQDAESGLWIRIILSDGKYFMQSMLATQLNQLVDSNQLDKNVVVKLTGFVTNAVQGRR